MLTRFDLVRTPHWPPPRRHVDLPEGRVHVGQADRTWLVPRVHATLAAPGDRHVWPVPDRETDLFDACAYWEAAWYVVSVLLGWPDPGLALRRLRGLGDARPESPALDLLAQVWGDDADELALWAWCDRGRAPEDFLGPRWFEALVGARGARSLHSPFFGGSNPLHLGHTHGALHGWERDPAPQLLWDPTRDRAVVLLDRAAGWVAALDAAASTLPAAATRYWHVDVVVRPIGWMGTYSRSKVSGRWYLGKHAVHQLGIP